MQIKAKKQLRIELDNADMLEAVSDLLAKHGHKISAEELAEVKFVNSVKDGLRATLSITEETNTDTDDASASVADLKQTLDDAVTHSVEAESISKAIFTNTDEAVVEDTHRVGFVKNDEGKFEPLVNSAEADKTDVEEPGQVEPSTVDDVALNVLDAKEAKQQVDEEAGEVPPAPERKKLFL